MKIMKDGLSDSEKLFLFRVRKGLSQAQLAGLIGGSQASISMAEAGRRKVKLPSSIVTYWRQAKELTEGEQLRIVAKREGFNHAMLAQRLDLSWKVVLEMMRGQRPIPLKVWKVVEYWSNTR